MTCHSGEDVIAFGMPSAKRTSPLSASSEPLSYTISRLVDGNGRRIFIFCRSSVTFARLQRVVGECATFNNFSYDLNPRGDKEARSYGVGTSRAKLWLARMKRGCAYLIVVVATLAIIVIKSTHKVSK